MVCTRKTKTLVSTCVILSGMTNIICLLYVGWVTNYIASVYVRGQEPAPDKKLEEDKGDTLKIIERLDHLENVIKQHIQGTGAPGNLGGSQGPGVPSAARGVLGRLRMEPAAAGSEAADAWGAAGALSPAWETLAVRGGARFSRAHVCARGSTRGCVQLTGGVGARCARVQMCLRLRAGGSPALGITQRSGSECVYVNVCVCTGESGRGQWSSCGPCKGPGRDARAVPVFGI